MLVVAIFIAIFLFIPDFLRMQDLTIPLAERARAAEKVLAFHTRLWPALLALVCLLGMHSFRVFHRFIGPLVRFERGFKCIGEGDLECRIHLRKNDFLREEETAFNEMMSELQDHMTAIKKTTAEAHEAFERLDAQLSAIASVMAASDPSSRNELRSRLQHLVNLTSRFRTGTES
jgi:methyl-accepting chemotaxis protein